MESNKSPEYENISIEIIKMGATTLLNIIFRLYNAGLRNSVIPDKWINSVVILIYKKRDIAQFQNFRSMRYLSQNVPSLKKLLRID